MPSLIQKHAHVKGPRSKHHIFESQPNPSWAKKTAKPLHILYNKSDDFNFEIVNFQFLDGDVSRSPSYCVYISQLIR